MNIEAVAQRALDLHEKASMPLSQALELALSEAAPSPIWPCAKLVIKGGVVSLESHQYAPGLPDGEHDVYPLPVNADAAPIAGVASVAPVKHWCETCEGLGTIDETLGGESFSNPKATCPDCDGQGWWTPRTAGVAGTHEAQPLVQAARGVLLAFYANQIDAGMDIEAAMVALRKAADAADAAGMGARDKRCRFCEATEGAEHLAGCWASAHGVALPASRSIACEHQCAEEQVGGTRCKIVCGVVELPPMDTSGVLGTNEPRQEGHDG